MLCLDQIAVVEEAIGDWRRKGIFVSRLDSGRCQVSSLLSKRSLGWPTGWRSSRGRFRGPRRTFGVTRMLLDGNLAGSVWPQDNLT